MLAALIAIFPATAFAQSGSRFEITGAFVDIDHNSTEASRGWTGEFVVNVNPAIGVISIVEQAGESTPKTVVVSRPSRNFGGTTFLPMANAITQQRTTAALVGVRAATTSIRRARAFGRALFGVAGTSAKAEIVPLAFYDLSLVSSGPS